MKPEPIEPYPGYFAETAKRDRLTAMRSETLRQECCTAINALVSAISSPTICRKNIEEAMRAVPRAYAAACQLDPDEKDEL